VSKAEGRLVALRSVAPSGRATRLARELDTDPRFIEVVLGETRDVLRADHGVLIVETHHGFKCANAGVDRSNAGPPDDELVVLLPKDPDRSARRLHDELRDSAGARVAVIVNDSHGRPWRLGTVGIALGVYGLAPLVSLQGRQDAYGRELGTSSIALADEVAAAASLVMGGADERIPAVLVRGVGYDEATDGISTLLRPRARDLFL
jgi:coenzyme F420-0:L-glutamate ligase/coenzyme F420-1:gamma-L-glutamate ligase